MEGETEHSSGGGAPAYGSSNQLIEGTTVFFEHPTQAWALGEVSSSPDEKSNVTIRFYNEHKRKEESTVHMSKVHPVVDMSVLKGADDLLQLNNLHESSLLFGIGKRFMADTIYTQVGPIVIAVNPFHKLPLYTDEVMKNYRGVKMGDLPPHIFAVADSAYRRMLADGTSQSILVSGESGAGKTETAKYILRYLASVSGRAEMARIQEAILEANPILEAFGNAKTLRNNNSSRFGKFMKIQFDRKGGLSGAKIINYLLEKSRVVHQTPNERNYHVFYQLLEGASDEEKSKWKLLGAEDYNYLNQSGCYTLDEVDDSEDFRVLDNALGVIGIKGELRENLFTLLSAILWLGNIEFSENDKGGSDITGEIALKNAADLLKIDAEKLGKCLTFRVNVISGERFDVPLAPSAASDARDALAKALFARIFSWLVGKINLSINDENAHSFIGLLDIFGFEHFKVNSLEQLFINFANEKLQQHYNRHTFKMQEEECKAEGINSAAISFKDNQGCLDLIEKKPMGLLGVLDEECNFPKASDATFLQKLHDNQKKNEYYTIPKLSRTAFEVHHYAATVSYESAGFLEKNKDTLRDEMIELISKSASSLVSSLFKAASSAGDDDKAGAKKSSKGPTVGAQFKDQLNDLITIINSTDPHWIRCIKPNQKKKPGIFEGQSVVQQLRCAGVGETIRIRREGFPIRMSMQDFLHRFDILIPTNVSKNADQRTKCQALIDSLPIDKLECQIGKSKVFARDQAFRKIEELKDQRLYDKVVLIQKNVKRMVAKLRWQRMRTAAFKFQAVWKMHKERVVYLKMRQDVITTQARIRGWSARKTTKAALKQLRDQRKAAASALPPPPPPIGGHAGENVHPNNSSSSSSLPLPPPPSSGPASAKSGKQGGKGGKGEPQSALDALSLSRPDAAAEQEKLGDPELQNLLRLMCGLKKEEELSDAVLDQLSSVLASATKVVTAARGRLAASRRLTPYKPSDVLENVRKLNPGKSQLLQKIQEQKAARQAAGGKGKLGGTASKTSSGNIPVIRAPTRRLTASTAGEAPPVRAYARLSSSMEPPPPRMSTVEATESSDSTAMAELQSPHGVPDDQHTQHVSPSTTEQGSIFLAPPPPRTQPPMVGHDSVMDLPPPPPPAPDDDYDGMPPPPPNYDDDDLDGPPPPPMD